MPNIGPGEAAVIVLILVIIMIVAGHGKRAERGDDDAEA